ncbi:MAG: TetR/AcrR family transcriptional regulator [Balneolaceae bacterium]|nr:TetR/AcrR family transcriptional regulator [Balneolaceae bacterium]MCH8548896.1 TetR/AcrR family transcriptional regulator [Balneolaceae bacterium]
MPKVVDHDAYRKELARKAADVFTRHGYSSLGIRQIANELGISKSLLYHYFSGKEDLFAASTQEVLSRDLGKHSIDEDAPLEKRLDQLFEIYLKMEEHFEGELTLMLDYLRGKSPEVVAEDENMKRAMKAHETLVESAVGSKHTDTVLCLLHGFLLVRYLNGRKTDPERLKSQLEGLLK